MYILQLVTKNPNCNNDEGLTGLFYTDSAKSEMITSDKDKATRFEKIGDAIKTAVSANDGIGGILFKAVRI